MRRIDRRRLLQLSSAGAVAASTGGLATILAARRAPAYAQGTALHWLRWADFVPASDQLLRNQIAAECQKALGHPRDDQRRPLDSSMAATGRKPSADGLPKEDTLPLPG